MTKAQDLPFLITRKANIVIALDGRGAIIRSEQCRDVRAAVALETKLTSDQAFAAQWAINGDPKMPEAKEYRPERPWRE